MSNDLQLLTGLELGQDNQRILTRTIPNTHYTISNDGTVTNIDTGAVIKPSISHDGYYKVGLYVGGKRRMYRVHRLVAEAFVPNPYNKPQVNHRNGDKLCVNDWNLEWSTCSENVKHAHDNGLAKTTIVMERPVGQYSDGILVASFGSVGEASRCMGISDANICKCCNGIRGSAGGYQWRYKYAE